MAWVAVALVVGAAGTPGELTAQIRRGPPAARMEMEREVQRRFQEQVRQELGLTDDQFASLREVVTSFQEERRALVQREMRLRQRLGGTGALLSAEEARAVLEEMAAVQEDEADLLRREQARLLQVLSAPQAVRFYTLRSDLADRIRRLQGVGGRGEGRPGPAGTLSPAWGFD